MTRGHLGNLAENPAYAESTKHWHITLQQSSCYWYDLIVNPPDFVDTKDSISAQLEYLRATVEQTLEKRFIYFFASRTKVRFDTTRPPKYSFWKKWLVITLLIGRDRKRHEIKIKFHGSEGQPATPQVICSMLGIGAIFSTKDVRGLVFNNEDSKVYVSSIDGSWTGIFPLHSILLEAQLHAAAKGSQSQCVTNPAEEET